MNEVNYILNTMSDRSLIIIDELCRSTSVEEGTAIAMMICEELAKSKAYTFITTHFTLLTKLADLFFNVKVWQLQTIPSGNPNDPKAMKLDFKFSLIPGATTLRGYGIYMVRGIWPADVLRHVDELQEQHTKQLKDPKFPTIDKRARLKYELDCQVKKLKLQKKFTLANLNKHVNHFYSEMQKLGGDPDQYSQNIMQQLQETMDETSAGLDHSIFDASQSGYGLVEELSKIGFDDLSSSLPEGYGDAAVQLNEEHIVFSATSSQVSVQTSIASLSEARKQMEEVFTPDSKLDISQATSWSINLSQQFEPEINLSYAASSQCSLNITQEALQLKNTQDGEIQCDNNYCAPEDPINIFEGFENVAEQIPISQLSSRGLSQQLENIRKQEELATTTEKIPMPPNTNWISAPLNPPLVAESPFIDTFARPLQADARKTSTPLITNVQRDAVLGTSISTSVISERDLNGTRITTPRVSFTVPRNMENLDIASVVEELESLADALEEDGNMDSDDSPITSPGSLSDSNHPPSEEINCSNNEEPNKIGPTEENFQVDDNNALMVEAFNSLSNIKIVQTKTTDLDSGHETALKLHNNEKVIRDTKDLNKRHVFANVRIIPGPNQPSSEEINCSANEEQNIIRPIVKNLQVDDNHTLMVEVINSLSNCKEPQQTTDNLTENTPNRKQIDVKTNPLPDTDEDIYETALSSEDTSCCYSPLTGEYQEKEENALTELANKENASHNRTSDEKCEEQIAWDATTKETERIEEVIEISSDDDMQGQESIKTDKINYSNRLNESSKTDFDRSTEKFEMSQSQKSVKVVDEITEKIIDFQDKTIIHCEVENIQSITCEAVAVLEEPVVEIVNDVVEDIPMPKENDGVSKQASEELELMVHANDCTKEDSENVLEKEKTIVDIIQNAIEDCEDPAVLPSEPKSLEDNLQATEKPSLPEKYSETSLNRRIKRKAKQPSYCTPTEYENPKKIKTQTDDKPSSKSSSTNSAENKQKTTTSVSEASKLRNLDGASTLTSSERSGDSHGEETITSLSEASRKRNLDKETTTASSADKTVSKSTDESASTSEAPKEQSKHQKKKTKKFVAPLKKKIDDVTTIKEDSVPKPKPLFVDPSKMSQKAIRAAFIEQDRKFYESSGSSSELAKIWEERLNRQRPTPKQIQQTTCLATIRKTNDGIEVIPAEKKKPRPYKKQPKIFSSFSSASMNMNIFSDENAETFDQFIKSDNKDYKLFNFKFGYGGMTKKNDDGKMFDFRQVNTVSSEYTSNSQTWTFVRKRSDEYNPFNLPSQASTSFPPILTPNEFSLTPEGFYKQNKEDINGLLQKYQ